MMSDETNMDEDMAKMISDQTSADKVDSVNTREEISANIKETSADKADCAIIGEVQSAENANHYPQELELEKCKDNPTVEAVEFPCEIYESRQDSTEVTMATYDVTSPTPDPPILHANTLESTEVNMGEDEDKPND